MGSARGHRVSYEHAPANRRGVPADGVSHAKHRVKLPPSIVFSLAAFQMRDVWISEVLSAASAVPAHARWARISTVRETMERRTVYSNRYQLAAEPGPFVQSPSTERSR